MPGLLRHGRMDITGRLVDASNATLFGTVSADGVELQCVYKPVRGERPLWDFPDGTLAGREVATFLISEAAGFDAGAAHACCATGRSGRAWCRSGWTPTTSASWSTCARPPMRRRVARGAAGPR